MGTSSGGVNRPHRRKGGHKRSSLLEKAPQPDALARQLGEGLLMPPARLFALYHRMARRLHGLGLCRTYRPGPPTVAVGGMSPDSRGRVLLTSWLMGWAQSRDVRLVVTVPGTDTAAKERPFQAMPDGDPRESGIEAALLARYRPEGCILVDTDPIRAARTAVRDFDPDLLILQDAVTDARLVHDLNLVILNPEDLGPGWNRPVPAGTWHGDISTLDQADAFCIFAGPESLETAMTAASRRLANRGKPVFGLSFDIWRFRGPSGSGSAEALAEEPYIGVFAESDRDILPELLHRKLGMTPRMAFFVHDRHRFTIQDFEHLRADAIRLRAPHIITSPRLDLKLREAGEALAGVAVWTYDPEVLFGPTVLTDQPFLAWWEDAVVAAMASRPCRPTRTGTP